MQYEIATTREPWKKKADGKLKKYQQLALEIRERQPGFEITVVTVMIGALGGCLKKTISNVLRILSNCTRNSEDDIAEKWNGNK